MTRWQKRKLDPVFQRKERERSRQRAQQRKIKYWLDPVFREKELVQRKLRRKRQWAAASPAQREIVRMENRIYWRRRGYAGLNSRRDKCVLLARALIKAGVVPKEILKEFGL